MEKGAGEQGLFIWKRPRKESAPYLKPYRSLI